MFNCNLNFIPGNFLSPINAQASRCIGTESTGFDLVGKVFMLQKNYHEAVPA